MPDPSNKEIRESVDPHCDAFETAWLRGERLSLTDLVENIAVELRGHLFTELLATELELRTQAGEFPDQVEYESRYTGYAAEIRQAFEEFHNWLKTSPQPDLSATIICELEAALDIDADPGHTLKARQGMEHCDATADQPVVVLKRRKVAQQYTATGDADYQINELLGEGGMGAVYAAQQQSMDRPVAIKVLKSQIDSSDGRQDAFVSEAIITGGLDHPNIVPIYEVGKQSNDAPFYAMKQVIGVDWKSRLGSNSVAENLEILLRVSDAIAFAHARGIIHRDLKPANIMLGPFGEVLVMDWGLAMPLQDHPRRNLFPVSEIGGTPYYMSPEMLDDVRKIDRRSDVYLLGGILFEIVTGRAPHQLESPPTDKRKRVMTVLEAVAANVIASTDKSGELLDIARKAIATDPANRYQSVPEFQAAIREYLSHEESIELASRSAEHLTQARQSGEYAEFSRARFGFETALEEWPENERAAEGLRETRFDYAKTAFERHDLDLALSLIDESDERQKELGASIQQAIVDRDSKQKQIRRLRMASLAASLVVAIVASVAAVWINSERTKAMKERSIALAERTKAIAAQKEEAIQREIAQQQEQVAISERENAIAAEAEARREAANALRSFRIAERNAYYSDILLLRQAWSEANTDTLRTLLDRYRDRDDLRGFEWDYWNRLSNCELIALNGHRNIVMGVAYSPDGTRIATASLDGSVRVWDAATGQQSLRLAAHKGGVNKVLFSPNGKRFTSCGNDQTVKVWDAATGKQMLVFTEHSGSVNGVSYSSNGARLASAGADKVVKIWDAETGEVIHTLTGHTGSVDELAFAPDGKQLASAGTDKTLRIWDAETGLETQAPIKSTARMCCVAFSPDGTRLAYDDREFVRVRDTMTWQVTLTLKGHLTNVLSLAFSTDGSMLCSASRDRTVKIWDAATGEERRTFTGHPGSIFDVAFSPDGTQVASADADQSVKLWDVTGNQESLILRNRNDDTLRCVSFSPDEKLLASTTWRKDLILWDAVAGQRKLAIKNHGGALGCLAFSPDGVYLAGGGDDNVVRIWDPATLQEQQTFEGHAGRVTSVSFSPDGTRLVSTSEDGTLKVWNALTGEVTHTLTGHTKAVECAAFRPDGLQLASASRDATVRLWDTATWRETDTLQGRYMEVAVSYAPDGTRLAAADDRGIVHVWDVNSGALIQSFTGHSDRIHALSFAPDGRRFATASRDGSTKVWDAATGQETLTLKGFTNNLTDVSFSPLGPRLATADTSGNVRVWDSRAWTPELRMQKQARGYLSVHRDRAESLEALDAYVREDQSISEEVRQQCLDWSELFWQNRATVED